ncbi:Major sperm protein (MSP) domain [Dillenia turbinata]|uniref:Major sperm protein (MSP) domain n=1 Tax=Dillenia turbinata TaxID=194707 RepID=A0AAN8VHX1_9MAGN
MASELLQIHPGDLKFVFELKKQSSCSVQLVNNSDHYVAFKVKTTSPKKYCVRPNIGIVNPKATYDFTVTMQAQRSPPLNMQCKDKFLIQSTTVPFGTTEEDVTSDMFAKDSGKYIEEKKIRVILVSPPPSPVLIPFNGEMKQDSHQDTTLDKDKVLSGAEDRPPSPMVARDVGALASIEELKPAKVVDDVEEFGSVDVSQELKQEKVAKDVEKLGKDVADSKLVDNVKELKLQLSYLEKKLNQAEDTIMKLTEERRKTAQENAKLKHELECLPRKGSFRKVKVEGFPLLFVWMVALCGLTAGYLFHS